MDARGEKLIRLSQAHFKMPDGTPFRAAIASAFYERPNWDQKLQNRIATILRQVDWAKCRVVNLGRGFRRQELDGRFPPFVGLDTTRRGAGGCWSPHGEYS